MTLHPHHPDCRGLGVAPRHAGEARTAWAVPPGTDADLFARLAAGDLQPLGDLFRRYRARLRRFLTRLPRSGADVDDLLQETFLTAARVAPVYDGRESAAPLLLAVAAQLVRRSRRTFARRRRLEEALRREPAETARDPEAGARARERYADLHAAIARLSHDHRAVLLLVEWQGRSGLDAARALKVPPGTVWRRAHEARLDLRKDLERERAGTRWDPTRRLAVALGASG